MALTTYTDLKAQVADWLKRGDMASRIPDFIALAESRINRIARVRAMENEIPLQMAIGSRFIALPSNFSVPLAVYLETIQPRLELDATVPETMAVQNTPGIPRYWCIDGDNLAFDRPADVAYAITLRQAGNFKLTDTAPVNALLTSYPDVYLYGSLYEGFLHIRNTEQATTYKGLFDEAVKEMNQNESRSRAVAPLRTDIPQLYGHHYFDIRRGY